MNLILGGLGNNSRLAQGFLSRGITYRFLESEFQFASLGGLFQVAVVIPSSFVTPALETVLQIVEALKSSPIKESELAAAKEQLVGWYTATLNSPSLVAKQVSSMELYDIGSDFLVNFPKRVQEVTERVEEVRRTILALREPQRSSLGPVTVQFRNTGGLALCRFLKCQGSIERTNRSSPWRR
jgi:predicted Zn-dependent peptidase